MFSKFVELPLTDRLAGIDGERSTDEMRSLFANIY